MKRNETRTHAEPKMPNESTARVEAYSRADAASSRLLHDFRAILDTVRHRGMSRDASLELVLAPLAALLIAKWAAHDESERQAEAAIGEQAFAPELPEAFRLPAWDGPPARHASAIAEVMRGVTGFNGAESAAGRYVFDVAGLVRRAMEMSPPLFEDLVGWVRRLDLGTSQGRALAADLFDDVLRIFVGEQGKLAGEFVTPEPVAVLMLELADPGPGDKVYDPCFGFGGLLAGAARRQRAAVRVGADRFEAGVRCGGIFGFELNQIVHAVGLSRTLLAGIGRPHLHMANALDQPMPEDPSKDGFDCILAVPPWGRWTSGLSRFDGSFPIPSRSTEGLFLQHVMAHLRPNGRAVVALPEAMLFRDGPDRRVREALLSDYAVDAVVSLPAGAFAPWTGIAASLVAFHRAAPCRAVRFAGISSRAWAAIRDDRAADERSASGRDRGRADGGRGDDRPEGNGVGGAIETGHGVAKGAEGEGFAQGAGGGHGLPHRDGFGGRARRSGTHVPALARNLVETIRSSHGLPAGPSPAGIEVWDVPLQDLALRGHELVAKRSGGDALEKWLDRRADADPSLKIERLDHVAEIHLGTSWGRSFTTGSHGTPGVVASLVRADDAREGLVVKGALVESSWGGGIKPPSLFLTREAGGRVKERDILRPGDILVTTSGTIGKVVFISMPIVRLEVGLETVSPPADKQEGEAATALGDATDEVLLGPGLVPMVAARSVAVVRVQPHVSPEFLTALLRSPVYRGWLSGHARGATVRSLSIRTLRRLRIPVPSQSVQAAVLFELDSTSGGDAAGALARVLSGVARNPVSEWLDEPPMSWLASGFASEDVASIWTLAMVAPEIESLAARVQDSELFGLALSEAAGRALRAWLDVARRAAAAVEGIEEVSRGAGRLAILEAVLRHLTEALETLEGVDEPNIDGLRSLTQAMMRCCEEEIYAMQESIGLDFGLKPAEVTVGAISEVELRVTNSSAVPLRSLHVSTRPQVGTGQLPYLVDGETHHFPLTVHPRDATESLRIAVSWQARRLDGTAVRGETELSIRVLSTREVVRSGDLGASPYIVGNPVDRQEMFFGRTDIMDRIQRQLGASTHANVILLEGNRRTGKTSILRQLGKANVLPGWIPVYCSLQDAEGDDDRGGITTRNVFKLLARTTGWALSDAGVETWLPGLPERDPGRPYKLAFLSALNQAFAGEHAFETFELYLSAAVDAASPRRVLLMLDEFDKLQEGIDAGITSPQVPENIRHLLQHQPSLSAIITGSRRLKRLREEYWSALFGLGYRIGISALSIDDARRLVTEPVEGRLAYLPQARDRLVELCAGHPFLVQSLCNRVFEQAAATGDSTATVDGVQRAATEMVRDNEHFRTLWDYTGSARRRLLLALCDRLQDKPDAVNLDLFEVEFRERGVPLRRVRDLADDVMELRELELLDFDEWYRGGTYRLAVPLMAEWLKMNVDFDDLVVRAREEAMEGRW